MTMAPERREVTLAHELVREARPRQWIKNLLVFAAPGAAGVLDNGSALWRTIVTFLALCLAASGTYFLNDVADVEADRRHPTKRQRPVAAGTVPLPLATIVGVGLLLGSLVVAASTGRWQVVVVVAIYIALTLAYSAWLKHIAVVDIVTVATGFVLRAIAGAVAVDVPMSNWFLICISFGSLFIVTGKRYAELLEFGDDAANLRPSLDSYTVTYLRFVLGVAASVTLLSYCLWAFEKARVADTSWPMYQLSIVPMATALLRYGLVLDRGHGGAPEEVFLSDRALQALALIWVVTFALGVYLA
ncbi:MAG TPA: decaprenyl-phosphate phosphoribosyltransferase [Acidimicrobiales bacterium]|jgi:decaprenyl-phosphate phosphoribosyltransferase